jgi:hypothetical protein
MQSLDHVLHPKALWLESIQLAKAQILEQGITKGLEEELEHPTNVHHRCFVEATNPEFAQRTISSSRSGT